MKIMNIYEQSFVHPVLNRVIDELIYNYLMSNYKSIYREIDRNDIRKAGWISTILADSEQEEHKQKAQVFAALLFILNPEDINCSQLSYTIFSRSGNLIATRFLKNLYDEQEGKETVDFTFKYSFSTLLDYELAYKRYQNTIDIGTKPVLSTDFQKKLWRSLDFNGNVSISAPTSSGKSFIIQSYIQKKFGTSSNFNVLYVVPSKALLNQVSEDFRANLSSDVYIRTAFIDREFNDERGRFKKVLFILTSERCLKLLQYASSISFAPDLIFVDEVQNVEDEEGRGVLMEYVLDEMSKKWPSSKFVSAGPFIKKNDILFKKLFNQESENLETVLSPVFQIKAIVKPGANKNELVVQVKPSKEDAKDIKISIPTEFDVDNLFKDNMGKINAKIVKLLAQNNQNIIYSPRTDYAENWAIEMLSSIEEIREVGNIQYLIDFLSEEIHPKYYLIRCLKAGVAFHHSKLPDLVRKEIEYLFSKGDISYLYCTSTLLQGVNLPANNLFVISPKKRNENLTPFEFGNLIGRAGRIKDSLFGTIYYIARNDNEESLAQTYYSVNYQKEVIPATNKAFKDIDSFLEDIKKEQLDIKNSTNVYTITLLRHKYLKSKIDLESYLKSKNLTELNISQILNNLDKTLSNVELPTEILKLNPSVDPLLQERLYQRIKSEGIHNWVITVNQNFYRRIKKERVDNYDFNDLSFYWQLAIICEKLDDIFRIANEAFFKQDVSLTIRSIAYFGFRWLQNRSYKEIIDDDLNFYANTLKRIDINNDEHVNKRIKEIMSIHSKVVTFLLVKYFKVLTDILEYLMSEEETEKYKLTLSLPIMLELGTTERVVIELISSGINRSVALKIFNEFKKLKNYEEMNVFDWLKENGAQIELKPIYLKYIRDLGFIE